MTLIVVVPPDPIITAAEAKARVPALAAAEDDVVTAQIAVATIAAENYLERAIGAQTLEWRPNECRPYFAPPYRRAWDWESYGATFTLPRPALLSDVVEIKYLDADGAEQTYAPESYIVSGVGTDGGRVTLKSGGTWPALGNYPEPLRIQYEAGYEIVPEPIVQAILVLAGEGVASGTAAAAAGSSGIRSQSIEGVGTVTFAPGGGSSSSYESGASFNRTAQCLLDPYRVF
jgi:hypothetical protein